MIDNNKVFIGRTLILNKDKEGVDKWVRENFCYGKEETHRQVIGAISLLMFVDPIKARKLFDELVTSHNKIEQETANFANKSIVVIYIMLLLSLLFIFLYLY
jgi:hypothetical protein